MDKSQLLTLLQGEMERRKLHKKTQMLYSMWIKRLAEYSACNIENLDITFGQSFLDHLIKREKLSRQSVHQAAHATVFYLKNVLKQNVTHESFVLPSRAESAMAISALTFEDVRKILDASPRDQDHLALSLAYGTGIELNELVNLRIKDIDFANGRINIRDKNNRINRAALLPSSIKDEIQRYITLKEPKIWLFESQLKKGNQLQGRPFQRAFRRAAATVGVDSKHSFRSLRYAYVMHMQLLGIPLGLVGKELGMSAFTLQKWLRIERSTQEIDFSPLDQLYVERAGERGDGAALRNIVGDISDPGEQDYLNEAINCYQARAYRAAIIMAWQAVIFRIKAKLSTHSISAINHEISRHDPGFKGIRIIDDLSLIKESTLLAIARDLGIYDRNVKGILQECLSVRNKCGHPGQYTPGVSKVTAYLEDILTHVFDRRAD